jgi:CheY-like chemotaxis protein
MQRPPLGEILVDLRLLTPAEVERILKKMREVKSGRFGDTAVDLNLLDYEGLARGLASQFKLRHVPSERVGRLSIPENVVNLLPSDLIRDKLVVPTFFDKATGMLSLLTSDPTDLPTLTNVQKTTKAKQLRLFVAPRPALSDMISVLVPEGEPSEINLDILAESFQPNAMKTVVLESDFERLAAMRIIEKKEGGSTVYIHDPEQMTPLLAEGDVDRVIYRKEFSALVEPYLPGWRRIASGLNITAVDGFSPSKTGDSSRTGLDFLLNLIEFILLTSESRNMAARSRTRRTARLTKSVARELGVPKFVETAAVTAGMMTELDMLSLVQGIVADDTTTNEGYRRYELARAVLMPLGGPWDFDEIYSELEERRIGRETRSTNTAAEIVFTVRAFVECEKTGQVDPIRALGEKASLHDPHVMNALARVLKKDSLRGQLVTAGTGSNLTTATVVIAEREAALITGLEIRLGQAGFETIVVGDGIAALEQIKALKPVAVIANMRLPKKDGLSLVMELKNGLDTQDIPIVLLTNRSSAIDVERGLEIGADDVLEKPVNIAVMVTRIRKLIAKSNSSSNRASLEGDLSEVSIAELLQTLHLSGKTCVISLKSDNCIGTIGMRHGSIYDAKFEETLGDDALFEMVALSRGNFRVNVGDELPDNRISSETEFLILEGLRRLDENTRG